MCACDCVSLLFGLLYLSLCVLLGKCYSYIRSVFGRIRIRRCCSGKLVRFRFFPVKAWNWPRKMDFCSGRPRAAGYQRPPSRARAPELLAPNKEFVHGFIDVGNLFNRHRRRIETALKMTATVCSVNAFFSVLVFYKHCATKEQNVIFRGCLWFNGNLACGWPCFDIYLCVINFAVFLLCSVVFPLWTYSFVFFPGVDRL